MYLCVRYLLLILLCSDVQLHVGGVPTFYQPGIVARKNFVGCIENFVWNGIYMNRDKDLAPRFSTTGDVISGCPRVSWFLQYGTLERSGIKIFY